jgi:DNA polymerase-1
LAHDRRAFLPILERMEATGIKIDVPALRVLSGEMDALLDQERRAIHGLAGGPFNVDSPKQLREVLFGAMGLTPGRKTAKSGEFSTDAATLEDLAEKHEIARRLLTYRELATLKGTYVDTLPELVNPDTGTCTRRTTRRVRRPGDCRPRIPIFRTSRADGCRPPDPERSSRGGLDLPRVRLFTGQLRVPRAPVRRRRAAGCIPRGRGHPPHIRGVFGVDPAQVTDDMRRRAKAVNFGILYGMSETRLARDQGMTRKDAHDFIEAYFERFKSVKAYIEGVRAEAMREGQVRTMFGRVRSFAALKRRSHRGEIEQALRGAVNTTIQGTAADLMKLAMKRVELVLNDGTLRARLLLQVHDELLLEVPRAEIDAVKDRVRDAMEHVHPLSVPLSVDQKIGGDWREVT